MCGMPSESKSRPSGWIFVAGFALGLMVCVFNRQVFLWVNGLWSPCLDWVMLSLTHLGNGVAAAMLVLLLAPVRRDLTIRAALAMIAAGLLTELLKEFVTAPRPPVVLGDLVHILGPKLKSGSFPSGHTSTVFALACSIRGFTDRRIFRGALVLAALVGVSRVYIGAHFPVDVVSGALLGWLSALVTRPLADRPAENLSGSRPVLDTVFLVLAALCGVYLAFFELMVRYNPWFLRPFGLAGVAVAVFLLVRGLITMGKSP